eukprot:CAMPEP_0198151712 /NCGR_PEP_ID=MMETSP1443-20131203/56739_1 /TAXON_ID=186043 /ORGANISM="Entomoneis sp., Strain CCMP2396" /LENGTH=491 /DNA_ID=CAMNT_0043817479 /DNA_START=23 /DNA_END=1498 /DNA_ORIENTATION=-
MTATATAIVVVLVASLMAPLTTAWTMSTFQPTRKLAAPFVSLQFQLQQNSYQKSRTALFYDVMDDYEDDYNSNNHVDDDYLDDFDYDVISNNKSNDIRARRPQVRASIAGVSVSADSGFWVMLQLAGAVVAATAENDSSDNTVTPTTTSIWPLQVTENPADRMAATSGQALTLVQLLSSVDMAGVILPPTVLAQLVICAMEEKMELEKQQADVDDVDTDVDATDHWQLEMIQNVKEQIRGHFSGSNSNKSNEEEDEDDDDDFSFTQASAWIRSRTRLPVCTLDQVHFNVDVDTEEDGTGASATATISIDLDVVVRGGTGDNYRFTLTNLSESTVSNVLHQDYRPTVSRNFMAIALALRYRAPMVVTLPSQERQQDGSSDKNKMFYSSQDELTKQGDGPFPMYTTVANLHHVSNRVVEKIERGFEVHKLNAAYNIARTKQDFKAMAKIQEKMDELDNLTLSSSSSSSSNSDNGTGFLKDLPVQPDSDIDCMQ